MMCLSATLRRRETLFYLEDNLKCRLDLSGSCGAIVLTDLSGSETEQRRAEGNRTGGLARVTWCDEVRMVEDVVALDPEDQLGLLKDGLGLLEDGVSVDEAGTIELVAVYGDVLVEGSVREGCGTWAFDDAT